MQFFSTVLQCGVLCRLSVYGDTHQVMRFTAKETSPYLRLMAKRTRFVICLFCLLFILKLLSLFASLSSSQCLQGTEMVQVTLLRRTLAFSP